MNVLLLAQLMQLMKGGVSQTPSLAEQITGSVVGAKLPEELLALQKLPNEVSKKMDPLESSMVEKIKRLLGKGDSQLSVTRPIVEKGLFNE